MNMKIDVLHEVTDRDGMIQSIGFSRFDREPTDDDIAEIRKKLIAENSRAFQIKIQIEKP